MDSKTSYGGTKFGHLEVPYFSLLDNVAVKRPYLQGDVKIIPDNSIFEIPESVRQYVLDVIKPRKEKEAKDEGRDLSDGPLARLVSYKQTDSQKLELLIGETSFYPHTFLNLSLDDDAIWGVVQQNGDSYANLNDRLANAIGTEAFVETLDGCTIIDERSPVLTQYPGPELYGLISGFVHPEKDKLDPFNTEKRLLKEQLGIDPNEIISIELFDVGRALDDRHVECPFRVKINYNSYELPPTPESAKKKFIKRELVEFTPEALAPYMIKTIRNVPKGAVSRGNNWIAGASPSWVPAQWMAVKYSLENKYGTDRVLKAITDEFRKSLKPAT